ncbi:hypothetical protein Aduo_004006 [Ancylostoma duodenale]
MGIPTAAIPVTFGCEGITKDTDREKILNLHNEYRANLTKGVTIKANKDRNKKDLPAAKNMYELEWDCDLEAKAEDAMNMSCKYAARRKYSTYGHSRGDWAICPKYKQPVEAIGAPKVLENWCTEGISFDIVERRFDSYRETNFVNMASGRNTKIGCAVKMNGNRADVYCLYDLPMREGSLAYEAGNGCKTDSDCTTYKNSTCRPSGLCYGVTEPGYKEKSEALETNCFNESVTGMTDEIRNYILDTHNKFRSSVARGLEPDMLGDSTPKAKKMIKLGYDCYLERVALRAATCPPVRTDQKLFLWNMHNVSNPSMSNMDAAQEAMNSWINQIRHNGLAASNVFAEIEYWRAANPYYGLLVPIEDYVNMVIDTNDRMGCIIRDCNNSKYVHCFYGHRTNEPMGKVIYEVGTPCKKNSHCTGNVECLVEEGLCTAP